MHQKGNQAPGDGAKHAGESGLDRLGVVVIDNKNYRHQRIPNVSNPLTPDGNGRRQEGGNADFEGVTKQRGIQHGSALERAGAITARLPSKANRARRVRNDEPGVLGA